MPNKNRRNFSDKFWNDSQGKLDVWKKPNLLLKIWLVTFLISEFILVDVVRLTFGWIAFVAIVIWAFLELFKSESYFRRTLGFAVLMLALLTRF